jgi:hypothetical protein
MSTNFYFTPTRGNLACLTIHIGLQAGGWEFMFHGYKEDGGKQDFSLGNGLRIEVEVPRLAIESHLDWLKLLRETPGVIKDEYGDVISLADFEAKIETLSPGKTWGPDKKPLQNHHDMLVTEEHRYGKVNPERDWKDAQGFSFSNRDFS